MWLVLSLVGCGGAPRVEPRAPRAAAAPEVTAIRPDTDADGYSNECDRCPEEAETELARAQEDGCPGTRAIVLDEIVSLAPARFPEDRAVWLPEHDVLADELARFVAEHPTLRGLRIVGHASPGERRAEWLARERAVLVRDQLQRRGVPESVLFVMSGVGATPSELEGAGIEALERVTFELLWLPAVAPLPSHCPD